MPLRVVAATAVDAVAVVTAYLGRTLNVSVAWPRAGGVQRDGVPAAPAPLPPPDAPIVICRVVNYTYYNNVVQSSYSSVWWQDARWEAELDWMAAHGVNIALAYGGQEALFRDVYRDLGLNDSAIGEFNNGPAYLAWSRGQGMAAVGGPLPAWWYASQLALNQRVVAGMVALGITPILPVFQGNVPLSLRVLYPSANISKEGWLDVFDPLFTRIADAYMERLLSAYPGVETHFYEADGLFSSGTPPWSAPTAAVPAPHNTRTQWTASRRNGVAPDPDALARSRAAYQSFAKHDPAAVWVYQSWIWRSFSSDKDLAYATGWLSGPPQGQMLLLDQTAERVPIWAKFGNFSFAGQPFAWLSMNNMGGNLGLVGSLDAVRLGVSAALAGSHGAIAAVGIDPEGIDTVPAYWDYVLGTTWQNGTSQDVSSFLSDWGVRRCGREHAGVRKAWALLAATVFRANQSNYEHHLAYCPSAMPLDAIGNSWNKPMIRPGFSRGALAEAWGLLLDAAPVCATATLFDLVDVGREFMSLFPCVVAHDALANAANSTALAAANASMVSILTDLDSLLGSHAAFLTGSWIEEARDLGNAAAAPPADLAQLEWNARSIISTWYPTPPSPSNGLYDYGNRVWSGVTRDYYLQRYTIFAAAREAAIRTGGPVNSTAYSAALTALGESFTKSSSVYPAIPSGDPIAISRTLYSTYAQS